MAIYIACPMDTDQPVRVEDMSTLQSFLATEEFYGICIEGNHAWLVAPNGTFESELTLDVGNIAGAN